MPLLRPDEESLLRKVTRVRRVLRQAEGKTKKRRIMGVDQLREYLTGHVGGWSRRREKYSGKKSSKSLLDLPTRQNTLRSVRGTVRRPRPYGVTLQEKRRRCEMLEPRRHSIIAVSDHLQ